jgi:ATP-dependent Lon protease
MSINKKRTRQESDEEGSELEQAEDSNFSDTSESDKEEDVFVFTKDGDAYVETTTKDNSGRKNTNKTYFEDEINDVRSRVEKCPFNKSEKEVYDRIVSEYEGRNITEIDIVRSNISLEDKTDAYELLRIIDNEFSTHGESENWLLLRQILYKKMKKTSPLTEQERKELNRLDELTNKFASIPQKIIRSNHPEDIKALVYGKYNEIKDLKKDDVTYSNVMMWINKVLELPTKSLDIRSMYKDCLDLINKVDDRMCKRIYGQTLAKEKIIDTLTAMWANPNGSNKPLIFIGSPGVGKTAFARFLAQGVGLPLYQISLGGSQDSTILTGFNTAYVGSKPGEIVEGLIKMGVTNGFLFLDEMDKLTEGGKGVSDTLLHILDPKQNSEFKDHFLSGAIPIDLSKLKIIGSVNSIEYFDDALLSRCDLIYFNGYSHNEKVSIGLNYIVPEVLTNLNMSSKEVVISEDMVSYIVNKSLVKEEGVRQLIRNISTIYERINTLKQMYSNKKSSKRFKMSYDISNFKLPITLTKKNIDNLFSEYTPSNST